MNRVVKYHPTVSSQKCNIFLKFEKEGAAFFPVFRRNKRERERERERKKTMRSPSSIILWFVRGLWPIISVRVEQYGAAVTVPVSVAVVRYQHLPRKAARSAYTCTCTHPHTRATGANNAGASIIYDSFEFRVSRLSRALLPIFVLGERGIEWLLSNGCIVVERMDYAFPHGNSLLNRSAIGFHGVR